jgi:hypothetical protein
MHLRSVCSVAALLLATASLRGQVFEVPKTDGTRWFKGNTHAHTAVAFPEDIASWFKSHGYQIVALTDHDR